MYMKNKELIKRLEIHRDKITETIKAFDIVIEMYSEKVNNKDDSKDINSVFDFLKT